MPIRVNFDRRLTVTRDTTTAKPFAGHVQVRSSAGLRWSRPVRMFEHTPFAALCFLPLIRLSQFAGAIFVAGPDVSIAKPGGFG